MFSLQYPELKKLGKHIWSRCCPTKVLREDVKKGQFVRTTQIGQVETEKIKIKIKLKAIKQKLKNGYF